MPEQLQIADDVLFQTVADEAVLLNIADNHYYGLDDVATRMWQLLAEHGTEGAKQVDVHVYNDVDEAPLRQDFAALVTELERRGLIKRVAAQQHK